jgi:DNA repair protein SbcC/Rad50
VDAVRAGAVVGDPCPVCGVPIAAAPEGGGSADIAAAKRSVQAAEDSLAALDDAVRGAERRRDAAESERADSRRDVERLEGEMERRRSDVAELEEALAGVGGGEKEDPLAVIDERLDRLERLSSVERAAGEAAAAAERLGVEARTRLAALAGRVAELRAGLAAQPVAALLARAARLSREDLDAAAPSGLGALPEDAAGLTEASANMSDVLHRVAGELERVAARRAEGGARLLAEAHAAVEGLLEPPAGALDELVDAAEAAARSATAESATAAEQSARLRERLEASAALAEEVRVLRERAERFAALARELRADNVIEFLQLEALELLAAAGSERLATLSDGRYRLQFDADEFFVVDTWNGEEIRSARTLSGGETFLASLALALALSDQVQSLAVSERARLESLFLDEGFGTLDPETLEVVVGAIEGLGGDERMVGVITHVQELAIRLPARVEVEKSPRGSSLRIVS